MLLVMPPGEAMEAVSPVSVNVGGRDSGQCDFEQPIGFPSSGSNRNTMGAPGSATDAADAGGVNACCVEHPAMRALAVASTTNLLVRLHICCLPLHRARVQQRVVSAISLPTPSTSGDSRHVI